MTEKTVSVMVPKAFVDGTSEIDPGHRIVSEETALRWQEAKQAEIMKAPQNVVADYFGDYPTAPPQEEAPFPFESGIYGKDDVPPALLHWTNTLELPQEEEAVKAEPAKKKKPEVAAPAVEAPTPAEE